MFPLVASSLLGFPIMGFLVLAAAHRAPQPTSEKLALTRRGQVTGHLPWEPFTLWGPQCLFPKLKWSIFIPFCHMVLTTWSLSWSHLLAHGAGLSFTKPKVTMENATGDPWRLARRAKSLGVVATAFCTWIKRVLLLVRQWAKWPQFPLAHRSSLSLVVWHCGKASQGQWTGQIHMSRQGRYT